MVWISLLVGTSRIQLTTAWTGACSETDTFRRLGCTGQDILQQSLLPKKMVEMIIFDNVKSMKRGRCLVPNTYMGHNAQYTMYV